MSCQVTPCDTVSLGISCIGGCGGLESQIPEKFIEFLTARPKERENWVCNTFKAVINIVYSFGILMKISLVTLILHMKTGGYLCPSLGVCCIIASLVCNGATGW